MEIAVQAMRRAPDYRSMLANATTELTAMANKTAQHQRQLVEEAAVAAEAIAIDIERAKESSEHELEESSSQIRAVLRADDTTQAILRVEGNESASTALQVQAAMQMTSLLQVLESSALGETSATIQKLKAQQTHFISSADGINKASNAGAQQHSLLLSSSLSEESSKIVAESQAQHTLFATFVNTLSNKSSAWTKGESQALLTMVVNQSRELEQLANSTGGLVSYLDANDGPVQAALERNDIEQRTAVADEARRLNETVARMESTAEHFERKEEEERRNTSALAKDTPYNLTKVREELLERTRIFNMKMIRIVAAKHVSSLMTGLNTTRSQLPGSFAPPVAAGDESFHKEGVEATYALPFDNTVHMQFWLKQVLTIANLLLFLDNAWRIVQALKIIRKNIQYGFFERETHKIDVRPKASFATRAASLFDTAFASIFKVLKIFTHPCTLFALLLLGICLAVAVTITNIYIPIAEVRH